MRQTQYGKVLLGFSVMPLGIGIYLYVTTGNIGVISALMAATSILMVLLFYRLVISATSTELKVALGVGITVIKIPIANIQEIRRVRNSILVGWGVRLHPKFTLYNVSGLDAIEIIVKNKKRRIRIGTNCPDEIIDHLNKNLTN